MNWKHGVWLEKRASVVVHELLGMDGAFPLLSCCGAFLAGAFFVSAHPCSQNKDTIDSQISKHFLFIGPHSLDASLSAHEEFELYLLSWNKVVDSIARTLVRNSQGIAKELMGIR